MEHVFEFSFLASTLPLESCVSLWFIAFPCKVKSPDPSIKVSRCCTLHNIDTLPEEKCFIAILAWLVLLIQGLVCQLLAWLLISYATKNMRATRVSVSLLGQAVLATLLAWLFLDEKITLQMILGGFFLLFGIRITFYQKQLSLKKLVLKRKQYKVNLTLKP